MHACMHAIDHSCIHTTGHVHYKHVLSMLPKLDRHEATHHK